MGDSLSDGLSPGRVEVLSPGGHEEDGNRQAVRLQHALKYFRNDARRQRLIAKLSDQRRGGDVEDGPPGARGPKPLAHGPMPRPIRLQRGATARLAQRSAEHRWNHAFERVPREQRPVDAGYHTRPRPTAISPTTATVALTSSCSRSELMSTSSSRS